MIRQPAYTRQAVKNSAWHTDNAVQYRNYLGNTIKMIRKPIQGLDLVLNPKEKA